MCACVGFLLGVDGYFPFPGYPPPYSTPTSHPLNSTLIAASVTYTVTTKVPPLTVNIGIFLSIFHSFAEDGIHFPPTAATLLYYTYISIHKPPSKVAYVSKC